MTIQEKKKLIKKYSKEDRHLQKKLIKKYKEYIKVLS